MINKSSKALIDSNDELIEAWKNFILELPHSKFVTLMELNLGRMESPFNKQKLILKLMSFLQKTGTKDALIKGLEKNDLLLLKVLNESGGLSYGVLNMLFINIFSQMEFQTLISNMEERLLIYKRAGNGSVSVYDITPFLRDCIKDLIEENLFLLPEKTANFIPKEILVNDIFLTGILSYCFHNSSLSILKTDGSLRKKSQAELSQIFPDSKDEPCILDYIFQACSNLGLTRNIGTAFSFQKEKCLAFANLSNQEKYIYLIAGAMPKFDIESFNLLVSVLSQFFNSLQLNAAYSKEDLLFYFFTLFSKVIGENENIYNFLGMLITEQDRYNVIDIAIKFRILCVDEDNSVYINPQIQSEELAPEKPILIDQSFNVTILPHANFASLINLISVMEPVSIQTTGNFKISKKTCLKNFEKEMSVDDLCEILQNASAKEIPKSVLTSINEWHKKITGVSVYKGFVIQVSEEQEKFFAYNAKLKKMIRKKLANGIYLLNIDDIEEFNQAINSAKLDFVFYKKKLPQRSFKRAFPKLDINLKVSNDDCIKKYDWLKVQELRRNEYNLIIKQMKSKLQKQKLPKYVNEHILTCIDNKRIFSEEQIINSPYLNIKEQQAMGLDFAGKLRLAQKALKDEIPMAIEIRHGKSMHTLYAKCVNVIKEGANAVLVLQLNDSSTGSSTERSFSIAEISKITLMPFSIFS